VLASEEWRSPFYLLALTSLVLPATALPYRRAITFGIAFTLLYVLVATATGIDWATLDTTARFESFSTHLLVPIIVTLALAYASGLLRRLNEEQQLSERLAIEAERRRLAWELHDSAKQRVHAAHLLLSSAKCRLTHKPLRAAVGQAVTELQAATLDMDVNLAELRSPIEGTSLEPALRERAVELERVSGISRITVQIDVPELPVSLASHVFRIASEAMTNAVRHADAERIDVRLTREGGLLTLVVADDGKGLPAGPLSGSNGMRSMRARAEALGGMLSLRRGAGGRGTVVRLEVPRPEASCGS
jgi:signal transduction histidine kinase